MTNYERIKGMSIDELSELLDKLNIDTDCIDSVSNFCHETDVLDSGSICPEDCAVCIKTWLESEWEEL